MGKIWGKKGKTKFEFCKNENTERNKIGLSDKL